jgi:uncharacterized protein
MAIKAHYSLSGDGVIVASPGAGPSGPLSTSLGFDIEGQKAYYQWLMSARPTLDSLRFARTAGRLAAEAPVATFDRLVGSLASDQGYVRYVLLGQTASGRPALRLEIDADVVLRCQYCLELFPHRLHINQVLPVARDEAELERWEQEDPLLDALLAEPALDVLALVEDEMLLGLPIAPRHPTGGCGKAEFEFSKE